MATLQEVIGNRATMDESLRERFGREFDAMTPDQQRAAYVHQARVIHEITYTLQMARDGHTTLRSDKDLLKHLEALAWSTDGAEPVPVVTRPNMENAQQAARHAHVPQHHQGYYIAVNIWLKMRGFETEAAWDIDQMDLPPDIRTIAENADITPSG
jgi:hypothetical protein